MDASEKYLKDSEAAYLLNYDVLNPTSLGKAVPFNANIPFCEMELPAGENFNNGRYYSPITKEMYYWTYNTNQINFISRIDENGNCQVVYLNDGVNNCLSLNPDPANEITKWRAYLYVEKSDCANRHGKYLIWTNGDSFVGWIDVEASIATQSFTTPFFEECISGCEPLMLCAPKLCGNISAEFMPLDEADESLTNNILDKGFKFIYRGIYYDNLRATEWSEPSTLYYEDVASCFYNSKGVSRCLKLRIPIGNPLWDRIELGFSKGDIDSNGEGIWYLADTIDIYEKYNSTQQYWYQRNISSALLNYGNCSFDYLFCNNKQCQVISSIEVSRVYNPLPMKAQGIIPVNGSLGFYNYEQGNCPIDQTEILKFNLNTIYENDNDCVPEMVAMNVRAIIHSRTTNINQFVWRLGGAVGDEDDITDVAYFGGLQDVTGDSTPTVINRAHDQSFVGSIRDFIVYVEGTDYFAVMDQFLSNGSFDSTTNNVPVVAGALDKTDFLAAIAAVRADGDFYYQQATLLVPKGMKGILRICSHKATGLEPNTSTKVAGTINDINSYAPDTALTGFNLYEYEIPFDCSQTEILKTFIIDDATLASNVGNHSSVETIGYVKDNIGTPLEGLEIWAATEESGSSLLSKTDYNGFYHLYNYVSKLLNSTAQIRGELDCDTWGKIQPIVLNRTNYGQTITTNATVSGTDYLSKRFTLIKAYVNDCNGVPVQGVKVAFSGSKSQITALDGSAIIRARNYSTRDRVIDAIVMAKYGCFNLDCGNNCNPCSPDVSVNTPSCYEGDTIPLNPMVISLQTALTHSNGLKAGGEYPFGFIVEGECGKISAVNELPNVVIDKTQKKDKLNFPSFSYDATGMILPDWANCVKIVRGVNLNDYALQWLVDKVEKTPDRKLKITIQSLNDYNGQYFNKTNTTYQYVDGDRVEFIRNGDGNIFDISTFGLLNYQILSPFLDQLATGQTTSAANYFNQILIDDDGNLDKLIPGALIELQHAKGCVTANPVFYSIAASIPTYVDANGIMRLVSEQGTFRTFDTYFVQRQVGTFSIQTFESKTPSDFWGGTGIDDTGQAYFVNKYENEQRYGRNMTISSPSQLNHFGDIVKTFDAPEQGDITGMNIADGTVILAIGENDWFIARVSNDLVKVGSDGFIRASSPDQVITDPGTKIRGKFGCSYDDIGSIFFGDGFVTWVDGVRNAHVMNNYSQAVDMSLGKMQSYFRNKIAYKNLTNSNETDLLNHVRWVTGQNKVSKQIYLTTKSLRQPNTNNDSAPYQNPYSTISFDSDSGTYLTFNSFIPEGYETFDLNDDMGSAFICFYMSIPYLHPIKASTYNNFFGNSVDMFAAISFNKFPEKLKNFVACEIQSDKMWFIRSVKTNDSTFESEVPPIRFKAVGDKWSGGLLGNKNSVQGIYSNKMPSGYFCLITFVRDNTVNLAYNSISDASREQYSELDLITCKFSLLEQSGVTGNL